ncbi:MAG: carotenoid 1,2-hydratase [Pseudomonadota bacterium]
MSEYDNAFMKTPLNSAPLSAIAPNFARPVPTNGYAWWYFDALSEDEKHGLTIIAFIGSVFSPYYAWARGRGAANPYDFCALNVALYGDSGHRWAMTERPKATTAITADRFQIGPSELAWDGHDMTIRIDERTVPFPSALRGEVTVRPQILHQRIFGLDSRDCHFWHPIGPDAAVTVSFVRPGLAWQGHGYFDMNYGAESLEDGFRQWNWSRRSNNGATTVAYNIEERSGTHRSIAAEFLADGSSSDLEPSPLHRLPRTFWRLPRSTRSPRPVRVKATFEDAPFYSRSLLSMDLDGQAVPAFHESLSLDRFRHPIVQMLLPFRMPRAFWQR